MAKKHQNTGARRAALQALYAGAIAEKKAGFLISQGLFLEEGERLTDYAAVSYTHLTLPTILRV